MGCWRAICETCDTMSSPGPSKESAIRFWGVRRTPIERKLRLEIERRCDKRLEMLSRIENMIRSYDDMLNS